MNGRVLDRRRAGGGGKGTMVIRGLSTRPGLSVDSGNKLADSHSDRVSF
jgi:hypothetical protein